MTILTREGQRELTDYRWLTSCAILTTPSLGKFLREESNSAPGGIVVVDLMQVLEGLAYVGFIAGAIFAVLELRGFRQDRSTELVMRMNEFMCSRDFAEMTARFMKARFKTAKEAEEQLSMADLLMAADYFEGVGYLAKRRLIPTKIIVDTLPSDYAWDKIKPWAE